jgi:hypothetical protein
MPILALLPLATEEGAGAAPYVIGGGIMVLLVFALLGILAFGKGREHS